MSELPTSDVSVRTGDSRRSRQGIYWLLTIPYHLFVPYLPEPVGWIRGQLETGDNTGYLHWQICVRFRSKCTLAGVQRTFGTTLHAELTRSSAAADYCWKEDTRVAGTQFELGQKLFRRNSAIDWDGVWCLAEQGKLMEIPSDIRIRCYSTLRRIREDFDKPVGMERTCTVFWGATGVGKSRRAWEEAGMAAYCKDPRSKFWCGYGGEENVVIDEFRGGIDVAHLLRWLDRYPVRVEVKGGSRCLFARSFWITSNLRPECWYPECDVETVQALLRRLNVINL